MIPLLAWPFGLAAGWLVWTEGRKKHWFGTLPDAVAKQVMTTLHLSNDPAHLTALSAKLTQVGATGAATAATQKAAAISAGATPVIQQGSTGPAVKTWQAIVGVTADGQFGPATAAATKAWQSAHGLTADGVVGAKTWGAAQSQSPDLGTEVADFLEGAFTGTTVLAGVGPSLPNLSFGSTGDDVAGWQRFLGASGWWRKVNGCAVDVDGRFGLKTRKATVAFQKAHGLFGNGIVDDHVRTAAARETQVAARSRPPRASAGYYPGRI